MVNALARYFQVIQFDHRGVGQSDQPDIPYSIEMMADDVAGLMQALQLEKTHVIGYSMGGQILRDPHEFTHILLALIEFVLPIVARY